MPKISQLTALTVPDSGDELAIVDSSASTTKKITRTNLLKGAPLPADTVDTQAIADGAVTTDKLDLSETTDGVDTSQSTTSTSFTNLATAGPAITIDVPASGKIWLSFGANIANSVTGGNSYIALAVSGSNTVSASETGIYGLSYQSSGNAWGQTGKSFLVTGLTPGSTTFTMKYKVSTGTGTFRNRYISAEQR